MCGNHDGAALHATRHAARRQQRHIAIGRSAPTLRVYEGCAQYPFRVG